MPRRRLRVLALLAALVTALLTSCGLTGHQDTAVTTLPDGAGLLAKSAKAMGSVTTTRVALDVQGGLQGLPIKSAEGQLSKDGSAKGNASLDMGQQLYEVSFVIIGKDLYLRGPTGGFKKLSTSSALLVYDPSVILDPNRGVARVLASGTAAKTEAHDPVDNVDAYRVQAIFSGQTLGTLVPGLNQNTTGKVWIAANGFQLVQAQFPTTSGSITFRFSDFDAPADITAPS